MNLGIDIGGTNISYGVVDELGQIIHSSKLPTHSFDHPQDAFQAILVAIANYIPTIKHVGIGAPMLNQMGWLAGAANMKWAQPVNIKVIAQQVFGLPVCTDNDANCSLYGEWKYGQLKDVEHGVIITLGTGVGGGLLLNGKPFVGSQGYAGEIGHVVFQENGRLCKCGKNGCYERYIAAAGWVQTYEDFKKQFPESILHHWEQTQKNISPQTIKEAALLYDELALEILNYTAQVLASLLDMVVCNYNPQRIILFGGILQNAAMLLKPTHDYFSQRVLNIYKDNVTIAASDVAEHDMGILGAAALCML